MKSSFELKIAGIVLIAATMIGCGRDETPVDLGTKFKESVSTGQVVAVCAALDDFMTFAPTNDLDRGFPNPSWTNRLADVKKYLHKINAGFEAVSCTRERVNLLCKYENRILNGVVARTKGFEEEHFYESSCAMLDLMSETLWKTTWDADRVLALWAHQRRVYTAADGRCREEQCAIKEEYRCLYPKHLTLLSRLSSVRLSELTEEELVFRDMWNQRVPYLSERNRALERLLKQYPNWDVGEHGRQLDGGRLYERFKSLTPEQLKEIEDRVRTRDKE